MGMHLCVRSTWYANLMSAFVIFYEQGLCVYEQGSYVDFPHKDSWHAGFWETPMKCSSDHALHSLTRVAASRARSVHEFVHGTHILIVYYAETPEKKKGLLKSWNSKNPFDLAYSTQQISIHISTYSPKTWYADRFHTATLWQGGRWAT
jgi:hypothetical protein